ncbi:MAG: stage II sporulation protein [Geobacteraceae bacterium]|nr:MAG: stage II sporulation protein [Geobacteraceae bacterium]
MKLLLATILLLIIIPGAGKAAMLQPEVIRVALQKGAESVRLDGNGVLVTDGRGEPLRLNFPLEIKRGRDGLFVNGRAVRGLIASAPAFVLVNGKGYRGIIECTHGDKGVVVVNELPLEDYLVGLINCEISSQWPMESIKAQAVIARSYAVYQKEARKNAPYHLESTVMDQVYEGCDIEDSRAARGVKETAGEVLTFGGNVIQAFYHSNCGGHTEASENVWGYPLPYLQGVECKYCIAAPSVKWEQTVPLKKIESLLKSGGYQVFGLKEIKPGRRNESGRLTDLHLFSAKGKQTVPAAKFRMAMGSTVIKSTNFEVRTVEESVLFSGVGYGHGVGLCQWGAKQRAVDGFDYREILSYYYPGTRLEKIFGD